MKPAGVAAAGRPYVWHQKSGPCHASGKWLSENLQDFTIFKICLANSPDRNSMDYYVQNAAVKDANGFVYNAEAELLAKIKSRSKIFLRD